jgi:hypothetical protein
VGGTDWSINQNPPFALPTPSHIPLTCDSGTEVVTSGSEAARVFARRTDFIWQLQIFCADFPPRKHNRFLLVHLIHLVYITSHNLISEHVRLIFKFCFRVAFFDFPVSTYSELALWVELGY